MQRYYGDMPHIIPKGRTKRGFSGEGRRSRRVAGGETSECYGRFSGGETSECYGRVSRGRRGSWVGAVVLVAFFVACFAALVVALLPERNEVFPARSWYYLVFGSETSVAAAELSAKNVREVGGAGFVINDGEFKVAAAVYPSEREAASVMAKQTEPCFVYRVTVGKVALAPGPDVRAVQKKILGAYADVVAALSDATADYDRGTLTESELLLRAEEGKAAFASVRALVAEGLPGAETIADYLAASEDVIAEAVGAGDGTVSSRLRRAACGLVYERSLLSVRLGA